MKKDLFNLEEFKKGRKAIAKNGRLASFLYYAPELSPSYRMGAKIEVVSDPLYYFDSGSNSFSHWPEYDLVFMEEPKNKLEGAPWELPVPPEPPKDHKWVYRGMGWRSTRAIREGKYMTIGEESFIYHSSWYANVFERCMSGNSTLHYIEAVPIEDPYADLKEAQKKRSLRSISS